MSRLGDAALVSLPAEVARPRYDRAALRPGIVHLGIGAFMRAHLAVATEAAIQTTGDLRWGIVGVSLRQRDTRDALAPQDGLYTLALRDADAQGRPRQRLQVIGCARGLLVAPDDPLAVLQALAHADARIASLTVTEKGYCHDPATHALELDHPDIVNDLARPTAPHSAVGLLVHGLALRHARGLGPLTLLSLDNLPANGTTLQGLVRSFARRVDPALAEWIDASCSFPDSMVDRIVPRTMAADCDRVAAALGCTDAWPVIAEPFFDWAVEDRFAAGRPDWAAGGVRFVPATAPWEQLKLRMVNGAHSAIAYLGMLAGWHTVDAAMAEPTLRRHVDALLRDEVAPTLAALPGLDRDRYRASLLARFANPALAHRTAQIAMDGSQKLPQRLLAPVRQRIASGEPIPRLTLGVAAWLTFLRGHDEHGEPCAVDDPLADVLIAHVRRAETLGDARAHASALTRFAPVFGDLADAPALVDALTPLLEALRTQGVRATLEMLG